MAWRKSPQALIDLFDAVVPDGKPVERRKMFGYPAVFVNGNLFAGLHQENFILRLSEPERETLINHEGARPFEPMPGRRMREYVVVPEAMLGDADTLRTWVAKSLAYANGIEPKSAARGGKKKAARKPAKPKRRS